MEIHLLVIPSGVNSNGMSLLELVFVVGLATLMLKSMAKVMVKFLTTLGF